MRICSWAVSFSYPFGTTRWENSVEMQILNSPHLGDFCGRWLLSIFFEAEFPKPLRTYRPSLRIPRSFPAQRFMHLEFGLSAEVFRVGILIRVHLGHNPNSRFRVTIPTVRCRCDGRIRPLHAEQPTRIRGRDFVASEWSNYGAASATFRPACRAPCPARLDVDVRAQRTPDTRVIFYYDVFASEIHLTLASL